MNPFFLTTGIAHTQGEDEGTGFQVTVQPSTEWIEAELLPTWLQGSGLGTYTRAVRVSVGSSVQVLVPFRYRLNALGKLALVRTTIKRGSGIRVIAATIAANQRDAVVQVNIDRAQGDVIVGVLAELVNGQTREVNLLITPYDAGGRNVTAEFIQIDAARLLWAFNRVGNNPAG